MGTGDFSLNPSIRSAETVEFQKALRAKIVGQDEGVQALVDFFQVLYRWDEFAGPASGESLVFGSYRVGQNADRGSGGGNSLRQPARRDQDRLRGVSTLP